MKEKIKEWNRQLISVIGTILIISVILTLGVIEGYEKSFFEELPKVFIFISFVFLIMWIISKIYNARKPEIIKRDEFIDEIDESLENLESYEKEDFKELKEEITNIRKKIDSFKS
jgi:Na+-transporting methylmalonyl-CoA/oxaloacetate decarboxylase gamma subunit